jgi:hypothetical protein
VVSTSFNEIDGGLDDVLGPEAFRLNSAFSRIGDILWSDGELRDLMQSRGRRPTLCFFFGLDGADSVGSIYERSVASSIVLPRS